MTRSKKLAALAAALAVLTAGPGCGVFDGYCDDCDSHSTEYQRDGLPTPRDAGVQQPANFTPGATTPTDAGVFPGAAPRE